MGTIGVLTVCQNMESKNKKEFFFPRKFSMSIPELVVLNIDDLSDIVCTYVWNPCCKTQPEQFLSSFLFHTCETCKTIVCHACAIVCDQCRRYFVCLECYPEAEICNVCKHYLCQNCILECCGETIWCTDCLQVCSCCKFSFCSRCDQYECDTCKNTVCDACIRHCDVCKQMSCKSCHEC